MEKHIIDLIGLLFVLGCLTLAGVVVACCIATAAYYKACDAAEHALSASVHAADAANGVDELTEHPSLAVPAAGAPGVSLPQVLQYWDLISKFIGYWAEFKGAVKGDKKTITAIRTKVNGRHVKLGPIPVEFED